MPLVIAQCLAWIVWPDTTLDRSVGAPTYQLKAGDLLRP